MKEKAANDPKMRTTKDMKLNFNKSFQTDELDSQKAICFITDIKVVTGPEGTKESTEYNTTVDLRMSPEPELVAGRSIQNGIGDPAYESRGEERFN